MNRNSVGNIVVFVVLSVAVLGGWWLVETYLIPKPPPPTQPEPKEKKPARETVLALAGGAVAGTSDLAEWPSRFRPEVAKPADPPKPVEPSVPHRLIGISGEGYNLRVLLTNKGAGVQQVVVPVFDQASRVGTTAIDEHTGKPYPLELVPGYYRPVDRTSVTKEGPHYHLTAGDVPASFPDGVTLAPASYTLSHYTEVEVDATNPRPSRELIDRKWAVVSEKVGTDETPGEVVFETTLDAPYFVRIRKTFTLAKTDFHVRMKLEFTATEGRDAKSPDLHYQVSGPRNVPIEGEWYSGVLRNAVIAWKTQSGKAERELHDAAHITTEHGISKVESGYNFTFAAVVNQFFAAAVCIDPDQQTDATANIWKYARATREWDTHPPHPNESPEGREAFFADKPQLGDITVRVRAKPIKPAEGKPVSHSYWLYHGPTKVRLLNSLHLADPEQRGFSIPREVVDEKYEKAIGLNVITDAPSPGPFGWFAGVIHWTDLVVWFTNIMHDILGWMHQLVPLWGVDILLLTVLVRLVLMLPSRRQQAGMIKMQEKMAAMKPELDKVQERFKNDPQRLNQEKTRLMLAHGVNPLTSMGGCLLMFAQMPVFLGLYYCLQESVFFRLDKFLWIKNLAAPDMLFTWSESIPFVSSPDQIGHSWYLGPFVNILPVLAVTLMYINFKISSPPPTDEQQEMQQRTMKFMMIFMGVFFYKMAAGLCVYFIVSTLWGMTERWLLKRKKKADAENPTLVVGPGPAANGTPAKPAGPPKPPGFLERVKQGLMEKIEEAQRQAESQGQQIINNPKPGSGPGEKPPQGGPSQPGQNGTGRGKKKKRKK